MAAAKIAAEEAMSVAGSSHFEALDSASKRSVAPAFEGGVS